MTGENFMKLFLEMTALSIGLAVLVIGYSSLKAKRQNRAAQ